MTSARAAVRIVLADDHAIFREALRRLLESEPGHQIVGEAGDAAGAVAAVRTHAPDVLLLDVSMPGASGLEALRELESENTPTRVVLLTAAIGPSEMIQALQLGARGIILKEAASELLLRSIQTVLAGRYWLGSEPVADLATSLRQVLEQRDAAGRDLGLTTRERQILEALVEGASNREIAQRFGLSEITVKHHLASMFDKCGVSSRLELVLFALHHGLARI